MWPSGGCLGSPPEAQLLGFFWWRKPPEAVLRPRRATRPPSFLQLAPLRGVGSYTTFFLAHCVSRRSVSSDFRVMGATHSCPMDIETTATSHDASDSRDGSHSFHDAERQNVQPLPVTTVESSTDDSIGAQVAIISDVTVVTRGSHREGSSADWEMIHSVAATDSVMPLASIDEQWAVPDCEACKKKADGNRSKKFVHTCSMRKRKSSSAGTTDKSTRARRSSAADETPSAISRSTV